MAVATLTGAWRSESALDRLRSESHSSDLRFFFDEADLARSLDELAQVDGIAEVGVSSQLFVRPAGSDLFPDFQLLSVTARPDLGGDVLDAPRIVEGRAIRPDAVDEIAMSEVLAEELGISVGDTIQLESLTNAWIDIAFSGGDPGPPDGPVIDADVVGLARTPADFGRFAGRIIHLSPAYAARYADQVRTYTWAAARVTDPSVAGLDALQDGRLDGFDAEEIDISYFADSEATQDGLRTIAVSLRLVTLAAVLAGLTAIGLTLGRLARDILAARVTLKAIGWTRAQLVQLVAVLLAPWVLIGITVGLGVGAAASRVSVVGLSRSVDPEDGLLLSPGWVAAVGVASCVLLFGLLGLAATRAARSGQGETSLGRATPRLAPPLAVAIAVRRAFFGASDRGGRASRAAAIAVAASVAVAVAALVVSASITRLQDDPSLSGQGAVDERLIDASDSMEVFDQAMTVLEEDDRVVDLLGFHVARGLSAPGADELTALIFDARRGDVGAAILSGRLPAQPDEVAVGPETLGVLDLAVGDDVDLSTERGTAQYQIVGTTLFPEGDFSHHSGLAFTVAGAERILGDVEVGTDAHSVVFAWADGVDAAAADRALVEQGLQVFTTDDALPPSVVANLEEVRDLPLLLAALVIALGLVTLVHALMVTTRLREREAGTLRALGIVPRAIAALVQTQGLVVAAIALVTGIPLGVALGRQVWAPIAERAHVVEAAVVPWAGAAWVAVAVLVGAAVLALPIAIRSLRQRPAGALRAE